MSGNEYTSISSADRLPVAFAQPFTYWQERRKGGWAPRWVDFHLEELSPKLLPWSVVVDVRADDFYYRFWGSERARLIGLELSGKLASQIPHPAMRDANIEEYREIRTVRTPMLFKTLVARANGLTARFHSLRLPISDDGETVTKIVSALDYQQIKDLHFEVMAGMIGQPANAPGARPR